MRGKLFNVADLKTFLWGWRFFFQRNAQRSDDALRFLSTLWGFYRRFEVSINALRFCCVRGKLFNVADLKTFLVGKEVFLPKKRSKVWRRFEVSINALRFCCVRGELFNVEDLKTFLVWRRLLKRNAYIFKNASANGRTYAGLTTLWGFYRRFEISTTSRRLFINHIHPNLLH